MKIIDPFNAKAPFVAHALISCLAIAYGLAMEVLELWQNGRGLAARLAAYKQLQLAEYDAPYAACDEYFIPGTDLAPVPGGDVVGYAFDILTILYLVLLLLEELPMSTFMPAFNIFLRPFGNEVGTWAVGLYLMIIGSGVLSVPPPGEALGSHARSVLRAIGGWALLADGGLLLFMGIVWQRHARWLRNQLEAIPKPERNKKVAVEEAVRLQNSPFKLRLEADPV